MFFFYLLSTLQIRFVTFNKTDLLLQITKSQACFSIGRAHIPALKIPLHMFIQCIIYTVERILSSGTPTNKLEEACSSSVEKSFSIEVASASSAIIHI